MPAAATHDSLVTLSQPDSAFAEEFRRLRTNVQFADVDRPLRTLAVAASQAGDGKSTTAANLAVAFAQAGKQVALVDADLIHPAQHIIFGIENDRGLTDALNGDASVDLLLCDTVAPGVRLLPAGTRMPNPAQLLNSVHMEVLIARLGEFSDVIIVDTPAIADLADSALLAGKLDGVLLVADSGRSRRADVRDARDLLTRVHAHILGVVLTHDEGQGGLLRWGFGRG